MRRQAFLGDTDLLAHTRKGTPRERAHNTVDRLCKELARAARHVVVNALTEGFCEESIKDKAFRMQAASELAAAKALYFGVDDMDPAKQSVKQTMIEAG